MNRFKANLDRKLLRERCCKRIQYDVELLQPIK